MRGKSDNKTLSSFNPECIFELGLFFASELSSCSSSRMKEVFRKRSKQAKASKAKQDRRKGNIYVVIYSFPPSFSSSSSFALHLPSFHSIEREEGGISFLGNTQSKVITQRNAQNSIRKKGFSLTGLLMGFTSQPASPAGRKLFQFLAVDFHYRKLLSLEQTR